MRFSRDRREREHVRGGEVLDVDERPLLRAVAVDAQRFAAQRPLEERGHHEVAAHARPERDAVAQHGVRTAEEVRVVGAEHLGRELARRVDVAFEREIERRLLVDDVAAGRGVDPHGAGQDDPARRRRGAPLRARARRPSAVTATLSAGSAITWLTSAMAARWNTGPQPLSASVSVSWSRRSTSAHSASVCSGGRWSSTRTRVPGAEQRVDDVRADESRAAGDGDRARRRASWPRSTRGDAIAGDLTQRRRARAPWPGTPRRSRRRLRTSAGYSGRQT